MRLLDYLARNTGQILAALAVHFMLFLVSILIATVAGVAIGIYVTGDRRGRVGRIVLSIMGACQSVPSVAVVALVFLFVGIGVRPAIIALVIYSLVPIVFNTTSGILSVPRAMVEAARGMGLTARQTLWKVKMPNAVPVILAGIRSAATICIGTATVASIIGGGGLGDIIFIGIKLNRAELILIGATLAASMAVGVDIALARAEKGLVPKGLRIVSEAR